MDGHFVPNITIGPLIVEAVRGCTKLPLDVHLMISDADRYIGDFASAGADVITVHVEACNHLQRTLASIRELGKKAGVVLNPATPPESVEYVFEDVDLILLMSVNPGFGGQKLIPTVLKKAERLKQRIASEKLPIEIEIDGGIKPENAQAAIDSGVDILVAGSAVFKSPNYAETIRKLRGNGRR
jgi:ribulose-phosphate 3-epimerase